MPVSIFNALTSVKLLNAAEIAADKGEDLIKLTGDGWQDRLILGLKVMLLGMGVVFAILILLWLILELFGAANKSAAEKKSVSLLPQEPVVNTGIIEASANPEPVFLSAENEPDDEGELVAVISAAVAAYLDKPQSEFRVVSFKRIPGWKNGGGKRF